jgi:hypothetical protein
MYPAPSTGIRRCLKIFCVGLEVTFHYFESSLDVSDSVQAKINHSLKFGAAVTNHKLIEPFGFVIFVLPKHFSFLIQVQSRSLCVCSFQSLI